MSHPELERFTPALKGRIAYEHLHRYALARDYVSGLEVLDMGCGEGYGAAILGRAAAHVTALDIDPDVVRAASAKYGVKGRVAFRQGDSRQSQFDAASFDVIVAFETIEHIAEPERLIAEARRLIRPGGLFIVSTPNREIYNRYKAPNPFHIKEMDHGEFAAALGAAFPHVDILGQRMAIVSSMAPTAAQRSPGNWPGYHGYTSRLDENAQVDATPVRLEEPEYLIAFCSDEPIVRPVEPFSMFLSPSDDLWTEHEKIMAWASGLHDEDEALRKQVVDLVASEADAQRRARAAVEARSAAEAETALANGRTEAAARMARSQSEAMSNLTAANARLQDELSRLGGSDGLKIVGAVAARLTGGPPPSDMISMAETVTGVVVDAIALRGQLEFSRQQLEQMRQERDVAQIRTAELARRLGEVEAEVAALREATAEARASVSRQADALGGNLAAAEAESTRLRAALAEAMETASASAGRTEVLSGDLAAAIAESEKLRAALAEATELASASAGRTEVMSDDLAASVAASEKLRAALAEATEMASANASKADRLSGELIAAEAETGRLRASLAFALELTSATAAKANALSSKLAAAAAGSHRLDELERATLAAETHARRLAAQIRTWSRERDAARDEAAEATAQVIAMRDARDTLPTAQLEGKDAELSSGGLAECLNALEIAFDELQFRHDAQREIADVAETRAISAAEEAGRLRSLASRALREASLAARDGQAAARRGEQMAREAEDRHAALAGDLTHVLPLATNLPPPRVVLSRRVRLKRLAGRSILHEEAAAFIGLGDRENAARNWPAAEAAYAEALRRRPDLAAIWVQYGHALKEQGRLQLSEIAYRKALALEPANADTLLHLGHLLKTMGREAAGRAAYMESLKIDPGFEAARRELQKPFIAGVTTPSTRTLDSLALELDAIGRDTPPPPPSAAAAALKEWPPAPPPDFWLPQRLRDYLIETWGEYCLPLNLYLFSVVDRYADHPDAFAASPDLAVLAARARLRALELRSAKPTATIIIPVYNNLVFTLTSIVSVLETAGETSFEILVGDDNSTDATADIIASIGGAVRHVKHKTNLGFLHNCNETAKQARGNFVVFLNNDTIVLPGWLDKLLEPFATLPDAGLVGSKLLNGDGTLQEAGGIFWSDGSAWNFGRDQDPAAPEFNYLRRTDYCSGASIAMPADLWHRLGGFDPVFAPAYCEDADIAFRVRAIGCEVYYQPQSELVHHEGRSHGRDVNSGIKAYQVLNQKKLLERWGKALQAEHFPNGADVFLARDRSKGRPHIVVVDHYVPQWDRDAGSRTLYQYMKMLKEAGFEVSFWPDNLYRDPEYAWRLQSIGIEVIYSADFRDRFPEWLAARAPHTAYVLMSRPDVTARYIDEVRRYPRIRVLYYGHDLHFLRMQRAAELSPSPGDAAAIADMKRLEIDVCAKCDVVYYPDEKEAAMMRDLVGPGVVVQPFPILMYEENVLQGAAGALPARASRPLRDLLFVGGFSHGPNVDGIIWFVQEVMPLLRPGGYSFKLHVVGSNAPPSVFALAAPDVEIKGRVSDEELEALYRQAGLAIVPLRFGAGVKGKVIEAMAFGVPVAMTDIGAQGIPDAAALAFVGSTPDALAAAITEAAASPGEATRRAGLALKFIAANYSAKAVKATIAINVPELAEAPRARGTAI